MKITIAYIAGEAAQAETEVKRLREVYPSARLHSDKKAKTFSHFYLTVSLPRTESEQREK